MGNPIQLEVELAGQGKQVEEGDQIAASDSLERENPDAPLLSTKSRAEDLQREVFLQQARDEGQGVPRVSGEMESSVQRNGDSPRVVKVEEDVKPLLGNNGNNSSDEISAVSNGKERSSMSPIGEVEVTPEFTREMELKCAPYVRHDTYGNFGAAEIPVREKILLGLALVTIAPIRMILIFFILVTYYFICKICTVSRLPGEEEGQENYSHLTGLRRSVIVHAGKFLSRSLLFVVGFYRIKVTHRTPDVMQQLDLGVGERRNEDNEGLLETSQRNPGAIVSNHISYLDILYHMSASFPSFVAKRSVAKLPLVGLISAWDVYTSSENPSLPTSREYQVFGHRVENSYMPRTTMPFLKIRAIASNSNDTLYSNSISGQASVITAGIVIERTRAAHANPDAPMLLLFPEGTTTNGEYLLPFKTGAFLAETPVLPVILKYPFKRFSPAWESITGVRHVLFLLCQFVNHLEVVRLPVYHPTAKECSDPKLYANNVRLLMSTEGDLPLSDIGLFEKRVYHAALAGKPLPIKAHKKLD